MSTRSLTIAEVRAFSKRVKLPKMGYCVRLDDGRDLCSDYRHHDPDGRKPGKRYYLVGLKKR